MYKHASKDIPIYSLMTDVLNTLFLIIKTNIKITESEILTTTLVHKSPQAQSNTDICERWGTNGRG